MTDNDTAEQCLALFHPIGRNIHRTVTHPRALTVRCERPATHTSDRSLGWTARLHQASNYQWTVKRGFNYRYFQCDAVASENGGGRCVKYRAHTYGPDVNLHHESADGLRWGGLVFIGPNPLSKADPRDQPERCTRVFAGQRCIKDAPHLGKKAYQHVVASGDVWIVEHQRGVRIARGTPETT